MYSSLMVKCCLHGGLGNRRSVGQHSGSEAKRSPNRILLSFRGSCTKFVARLEWINKCKIELLTSGCMVNIRFVSRLKTLIH